MSNLSDVKRRLQSVRKTRQITSAMETVSIAKMRKTLEKRAAASAYIQNITQIMKELARCGADGDFTPSVGVDILIVLSSDRGLCGGFDSEIIRLATSHIAKDTIVMPIGGAASTKFKSHAAADFRFCACYIPESDVASAIADELLKLYGNTAKSISIAYSKYSTRGAVPTISKLLPVERDCPAGMAQNAEYFEPNARVVYERILPLYLSARIFEALIENFSAECGARHTAMSAATDSADEMISSLSLEYNRARQAAVTEQIVEIAGATAALGDALAKRRKEIDHEKKS